MAIMMLLVPNAPLNSAALACLTQIGMLETIRPMVEHLIETFGTERIMFGSNFPVDKLMRTYEDCVADIAEIIMPFR